MYNNPLSNIDSSIMYSGCVSSEISGRKAFKTENYGMNVNGCTEGGLYLGDMSPGLIHFGITHSRGKTFVLKLW